MKYRNKLFWFICGLLIVIINFIAFFNGDYSINLGSTVGLVLSIIINDLI